MHTLIEELQSKGWRDHHFNHFGWNGPYVRIGIWFLPPQSTFSPSLLISRLCRPKLSWTVESLLSGRRILIERNRYAEIADAKCIEDENFRFDEWLEPLRFDWTRMLLRPVDPALRPETYWVEYGALSVARGVWLDGE